eukprot:4285915-Pleurochrysis_carterae.AAC.1
MASGSTRSRRGGVGAEPGCGGYGRAEHGRGELLHGERRGPRVWITQQQAARKPLRGDAAQQQAALHYATLPSRELGSWAHAVADRAAVDMIRRILGADVVREARRHALSGMYDAALRALLQAAWLLAVLRAQLVLLLAVLRVVLLVADVREKADNLGALHGRAKAAPHLRATSAGT